MDELDGFSLLLVDDHPLFREGLVLALRQRAPQMQVQAVGTATEALEVLAQPGTEVDLVLLDYRLPVDNGLVSALRLRERFPQVACALISGLEEPQLAHRARAAGLMGYFPKSLARGEPCFHGHAVPPAGAATGAAMLTPRQREVLRMVASGATNKEIAQVLQIAPHTVRNHLGQIFERIGAANRAQAAVMAHDLRDHG
jgi:two-component system, NarL family, nitrate/nitrite response regulator NarL